jgi:hypothetical protein
MMATDSTNTSSQTSPVFDLPPSNELRHRNLQTLIEHTRDSTGADTGDDASDGDSGLPKAPTNLPQVQRAKIS